MKKTVFLYFFLLSLVSIGQSFEITPQGGYMLGGRAQFIQGDISIKDNGNFGLNFAVDFGYQGGVEVSYAGMLTTADFRASDLNYTNESFKLGVHYFQIGVYQDFGKGKLKGYGNFSIGATLFQAYEEKNISDLWNFSATLSGGMKYYFKDFVGIKLYARLLVPMTFYGGGAYCGIGTGGAGCGLGVSSYSFIVQGDFGAGLIFRINK